ncbi:MAG: group III truncated hemoglobin [Aggregatilineales bacterium]
MTEKLDQITEESIKQLVDNFYIKVRQDTELAPVFNRAIGHSDEEWQPHLEKLYAFWSSVMLISRRYHGNPIKKHADLPPFDVALFNRWLELFAETAYELHTADIAIRYQVKSQNIARNLRLVVMSSLRGADKSIM